jgi:ketosteroid isomerase-like protein
VIDSPNVALVRSICTPWEAGDYTSADWADAEIEIVVVDGPAPGRWAGLDGLPEVTRELLSPWESVRTVSDEFRELDDHRILVPVHRLARAKGSGLEMTEMMRTQGANLFHLREGKVTRFVVYWDRDRAFSDLGVTSGGDAMPEEPTTPDLVAKTREGWDSVNRQDIDAMMSFYAPDAVWDAVLVGKLEGAAAIRGFLEEWFGGFSEYEAQPAEIIELGNGVVFAVVHHTARPVASEDGGRFREVWAYASVWVSDLIARVISSRDIGEVRAVAERLAKERG